MSLLDPKLTFSDLSDQVGLDHRLKKALARLGHIRPTLVQSRCLPLALTDGRDLLVRARTGSGKTLAYTLPLLQKIMAKSLDHRTDEEHGHGGCVEGIILVPSKELVSQVFGVVQSLSYYATDVLRIAMLSSGKQAKKEERARQEAMLRDQPNVIVATPGGLLTHIRSGSLDLKDSVQTLVVDEADLVLSFGYTDDVTEIMKHLPKICQGFLMSATLPPELNQLKNIVLHSPAVVKLEEEVADKKEKRLVQYFLPLPKKDKYLVVYVFLKLGLLKGKGLFFVNSTDGAYALKLFLEQFHIRSAVLNAELPLKSRLNIIEHFNVGNFDYLIATDDSAAAIESGGGDGDKKSKKDKEYGVARGLDFRRVSFVVNVDFPTSPDSYTHRVGRTARGGAKGVALSLVDRDSDDEYHLLQRVQNSQPPLPIRGNPPAGHPVAFQPAVPPPSAEGGGHKESQFRPQPSQLDFDLSEIEGFRYRVEDVARSVTRALIRDTRAAELKAEILNSERLQNHFEDNPADLQLLRHDRTIGRIQAQEHLKHVPKYMLPRGMQVADLRKRRKKRKIQKHHSVAPGERRKDNDPLQAYEQADGGAGDDFEEFFDDEGYGDDDGKKEKKPERKEAQIFASTKDGTGKSTSGRNAWKEKHKKGKFSNKRRKSDPKRRRIGI